MENSNYNSLALASDLKFLMVYFLYQAATSSILSLLLPIMVTFNLEELLLRRLLAQLILIMLSCTLSFELKVFKSSEILLSSKMEMVYKSQRQIILILTITKAPHFMLILSLQSSPSDNLHSLRVLTD